MRIRGELLKRLGAARHQRPQQGWAGRSFDGATSRVFLISLTVWHGVMALTALWSLGLTPVGLVVSSGHLAAAAAALLVLRAGRRQLPLILCTWVLFVVDWAVAPSPESALLFAACWLCNLNDALPAFLLRGRASHLAPMAAVVALPLLMVLARPEWASHPLVLSVPVTLLAITAATRIGLSYLLDYTHGVDAETLALERNMAALATRKAATHQAAEDARVLHDTAINTLGAIANGGAAVRDVDAVRQRCLADINTIESLRSSRGDDGTARPGFRDAIRPLGIRLKFSGMTDDEIARTEALLPPRVVRALSRAVAEAVQNAAQHSGADEVVVSITRTVRSVCVTVRDQGVGIQGDVRRHGGVERSILERAHEAGIQATIESAPEQGTTVTLDYAFDAGAGTADAGMPADGKVADLVGQLRSRAVFAFSAGLVGVGVALAALNHPGQATPEWLMVATVAAACALAWRERAHTRPSVVTLLALMVAAPAAFFLSAWSVDFGRGDPVLWQAIAPTGPLLVLLMASPPAPVRLLSLAVYLLTVGAIALAVRPAAPEAALVIVLAGLVGIGLVQGIGSFMRNLAKVAARADSERQATFTLDVELAAVEAAAEARRRWREAGLDESIKLLLIIADGRAHPADPEIQDRCAEEEAFLRQLSLLNPELIQMGTWLARALNASRTRRVDLAVRAGAADVKADDAHRLGQILLTVVDAMPPGTRLTTALFATVGGLTMTLVAPTPHLVVALNDDLHSTNVLKLRTIGQQDLAEFVVTGTDP